jgi:hypothetical protein
MAQVVECKALSLNHSTAKKKEETQKRWHGDQTESPTSMLPLLV